ncbi:MAG: SGNH/GDSL hydrolase family protein [Pseudomonadota bacterium]
MVKFFRSVAWNVAFVTIPSLCLLGLLLEVMIRLFFPVSDVPQTVFSPGIGNHFLPNQKGIYIKGVNSEIKARYRINSDGWNSPYEYSRKKSDKVYRIAVIGDSYVEALQVDYDKSFPYLLEMKLSKTDNCEFEVYSFGHSGANLIQYLNVLRNAVVQLRPDLVIYNIVYNDFQESLYGYARKDNWSVSIKGKSINQVPPIPLNTHLIKRIISKSALARYIVINLDILSKISLIRDFLAFDERRHESNIDLDADVITDQDLLHNLLQYFLSETNKVADKVGFDVALVIDANREAIYRNTDPSSTISFRLNTDLSAVAKSVDIKMLDLTDVFLYSWKKLHKPFNWDIDSHWNDTGHELVAQELTKFIHSREHSICD